MKISFLLISLIFFAISCTIDINDTNPPSWYTKITNDNNPNIIFGRGYGATQIIAEQNALNSISQQVLVNVTSDLEIIRQESVANEKSLFLENTIQNIEIQAQNIDVSKFAYVNQEFKNNNYYVLISVSKSDLIDTYNNKLTLQKYEIKNLLEQKPSSSLVQKKIYNQIQKAFQKMQNDIQILTALDAENEVLKELSNIYLAVDRAQLNLDNQLLVNITSAPEDEKIADVISEGLANENIRISALNKKSSNVFINIKTQKNKHEVYGLFAMKLKLNISLTDDKGNIISTINHDYSATSNISYENAYDIIVKQLARKISGNGIFSTLNLR